MLLSGRWIAPGVLVLAVSLAGACGGDSTLVDAADSPADAPPADAPLDAVVDVGPGSQTNPAASCAELLKAGGATSGTYWVTHPEAKTNPFPVFCEQELNGGGWAMVLNSARNPGTTLAFWQIPYAARFDRKGVRRKYDNYYDGALYLIGKEYMDVIADLNLTTKVAAVMTTSGIDPNTMKFGTPALISGNAEIFLCHFASGWASADFDQDTNPGSCAAGSGNVTQHYCSCWNYNLGHDADPDGADGGVGPHVYDGVLAPLGLVRQRQPEGYVYSQVQRIARFTRW